MVLIIGTMWVVRLPLAYLLAVSAGYGALGVWLAMVISMMFYGMAVAVRYRLGKWKSLRP